MADEKKKGFWAEFKEFILQGDALDMAVGVVIGGAFTAIVTALVNGLINPIIGVIGGNDIESLSVTLLEANAELGTNAVTLNYGTLISAIINFLLVGFILFCIVRAINKLRDAAKKAAGIEDDEEEVVETDSELLKDIRDLMKERNELDAAKAERIAKARAAKAKAAEKAAKE